MTTLLIPGPRTSHVSQTLTLEGVAYRMDFDWIQRWQRWVVGVYSANGDQLVSGAPLVTGVNILKQYQYDPRVPQGVLFVTDLSGSNRDPAWYGFHDRESFEMVYITAS